MIFDLEKIEDSSVLDKKWDVAIVGAGPAGITLALELSKTGAQILLLEGGNTDFSEASQASYAGNNIGIDYFDLETSRLRYLGGASNHWEGQCRFLDEHDFVQREYLNATAWPFGKKELDPYRDQCFDILDLRQVGLHDRAIPRMSEFREVEFFFSDPTRFGEKYRSKLETSKNIDLYLNATVTNIGLDTETDLIANLDLVSTESKKHFTASAKLYVLALGGLENPRLLLNSNKVKTGGIGNANDLVGRYFMEHIIFDAGEYVSGDDVDWGKGVHYVSPTKQYIERNNSLNTNFWLTDYKDYPKKKLKRLLCDYPILNDIAELVRGRPVSCLDVHTIAKMGSVIVMGEQTPTADSRVTLSKEQDAFGLQRINLDWQVSKSDLRHLKHTILDFASDCADKNLARLKLDDAVFVMDELSKTELGDFIRGGYHHLGTTRIGTSSKDGVVDANCRVFDGHDNLFIAGSSVFPTGGYANPTYTIIQMTLRLAKHLSGIV